MVNDYTQLPENILIDLINSDNNTTFNVGELVLSAPEVVTDEVSEPSFNNRFTRVKVTAPSNPNPETNSVSVKYRRLHYRDLFSTDDPNTEQYPLTNEEYRVDGLTRLAELIPQINQQFELNLQSNDFYDQPLPIFNEANAEDYVRSDVRLEAKPNSLIYVGGVRLKLNLIPIPWTDLHTLLTSTMTAPSYW